MDANFKDAELRKAVVVNLSHISIFSQILHSSPDTDVAVSLLSSATSTDSRSPRGDSPKETQLNELIGPAVDSASCSSYQTSALNFRSCILNKFGALISIQMPLLKDNGLEYSSQIWAGDGFISRCDLTITITEIKVSISIVYFAFHLYFDPILIQYCLIFIPCLSFLLLSCLYMNAFHYFVTFQWNTFFSHFNVYLYLSSVLLTLL